MNLYKILILFIVTDDIKIGTDHKFRDCCVQYSFLWLSFLWRHQDINSSNSIEMWSFLKFQEVKTYRLFSMIDIRLWYQSSEATCLPMTSFNTILKIFLFSLMTFLPITAELFLWSQVIFYPRTNYGCTVRTKMSWT